MKKIIFSLLFFMTIATVSATNDTTVDSPRNNWGAKLKESNFHLGVELQTKYIWRGMEVMPENSAPILFPSVSYVWKGFSVCAIGGYAVNGKYAEIDLGVCYTWKGLSICLYDYYYPTTDSYIDHFFTGGKNTKHCLDGSITYAPENVPLWASVSTIFFGADKYMTDEVTWKQAYSTYIELGTYYDFLHYNRISLGLGAAVNKSCYNGYEKGFSICNIDLKYTYNVTFKSEWTLPLTAELIYNPVYDKMHFNLTVIVQL